MKKLLALLITSAIVVGCNSGTTQSNQPQAQISSKQVFVSQTQQILTPVSSNSLFRTDYTAPEPQLVTNNCIQLAGNAPYYTTAINSSQWWSTGSITFGLQNICGTAESVTSTVVLNTLLVNGAPVISVPSVGQQSGPLYMNTAVTGTVSPSIAISSPSCSGDYCNWAELQPNAIQRFTVQVGYSGPIQNLSLSSLTLAGGPTPKPPQPGSAVVTVDASAIVNACGSNCSGIQVSLVSPTGSQISEAINPATAPVSQYTFQNLAVGQYSVVVNGIPTVSGGTITSAVLPSTSFAVTSNVISAESVVFSFQPVAVVNTLNLSLGNVPSNLFNGINVLGRILDSNGANIQSLKVGLGSSQTISSAALLANEKYTIEVQGLADPLQGVYFAPIVESFTVSKGANSLLLNYGAQVPQGQLLAINFQVTNPNQTQTVNFGSNNNYFNYNNDILESATYYFSKQDAVYVTPSSLSGYITTTGPKNPLLVESDYLTYFGSDVATVMNTQITPSAESGLSVGYLSQSYGIGGNDYTMISEAAQAGYNTVVVAFATLNNNAPMTFYGDQFLAYTGSNTFSACPAAINVMTNDIANAKKSYGLKYALVSVGGANSTLTITPGVANPQTIAANVVSFLNTYGLDGIDFDVEQQIDPTTFAAILQAIKAAKPDVIITAAPQSNGVGNNNAQLVTTGNDANYNDALQAGLFNYIWIQGYNTGGYTLGGSDETMVGFITGAVSYYTSGVAGGSQIPVGTFVMVGEPADVKAAGSAQIWNNPSTTYATLASAYQSAMALPQNGGSMTWSINHDIVNGCQFTNAVSPVVTGVTPLACSQAGVAYHGPININACAAN